MKRHGIRRRDKFLARELALSKGKIIRNSEDEYGNNKPVILQKNITNKNFFKSWSSEMAYVLGVLYTDGNLQPQRNYSFKTPARIQVFQKEPELLQKILNLMQSNSKLYFRKQRGTAGAGYMFSIADKDVYEDLQKLGLKPSKSLSLEFPNVDPPYSRDFIRGCWDGDGTVYWESNDPNKARAGLISGSRLFIEGLIKHLVKLGLPDRTIHTDRRRAFYFRYTGMNCAKLYHILYDGVPEGMYLTRKYERFNAIADYFDKH